MNENKNIDVLIKSTRQRNATDSLRLGIDVLVKKLDNLSDVEYEELFKSPDYHPPMIEATKEEYDEYVWFENLPKTERDKLIDEGDVSDSLKRILIQGLVFMMDEIVDTLEHDEPFHTVSMLYTVVIELIRLGYQVDNKVLLLLLKCMGEPKESVKTSETREVLCKIAMQSILSESSTFYESCKVFWGKLQNDNYDKLSSFEKELMSITFEKAHDRLKSAKTRLNINLNSWSKE